MSINQEVNKTKRKDYFPDPRVPVLESLLSWNFHPEFTYSRGLAVLDTFQISSLLGMPSAPVAAFSFMTVFYTRNKMA